MSSCIVTNPDSTDNIIPSRSQPRFSPGKAPKQVRLKGVNADTFRVLLYGTGMGMESETSHWLCSTNTSSHSAGEEAVWERTTHTTLPSIAMQSLSKDSIDYRVFLNAIIK